MSQKPFACPVAADLSLFPGLGWNVENSGIIVHFDKNVTNLVVFFSFIITMEIGPLFSAFGGRAPGRVSAGR